MPFLDAGRRIPRLKLDLKPEDQKKLDEWLSQLDEWLKEVVTIVNTNAGAPEVVDEGSTTLPDVEAAHGRLYYIPDTGELWFSDGSTWKQVTLV